MEHASERRTDAGFGAGPFEHDAIEDFDLIEVVAFGFEKLPTLVDGCLHNRIVICSEGDVWTIGFEQVLVNAKAWPKRFEGRFEPLHCVFLLRAVKTFIVHASNA